MTLPPAMPPAQNPGSEIALFSNDEFRLEIAQNGTDGFRVPAPPVAHQLGFRAARDLLRSIPDDEKGYELARTPNGLQQQGSYLTEKGFYRALGQRQAARISDPTARAFVERFQSWVFGEVLPAIRRGELTPAPAGQVEVVVSPRSEIDLIIAAAVELKRMTERVDQLEAAAADATQDARVANARIDAIEGRHDWFSALGYAKTHNLATDSISLARLGKLAATLARADGIEPNKVQHSHFGTVNEFPEHVWDRAVAALGGAA